MSRIISIATDVCNIRKVIPDYDTKVIGDEIRSTNRMLRYNGMKPAKGVTVRNAKVMPIHGTFKLEECISKMTVEGRRVV